MTEISASEMMRAQRRYEKNRNQIRSQFVKICGKLAKQVPAASYLKTYELSNFLNKEHYGNPGRWNQRVTHTITADKSILFKYHELFYLLSVNSQGSADQNGQLVYGTATQPDGTFERGRFEYITDLKTTELTDGSKKFRNNIYHCGRFKYIADLKTMELICGRKDLSENNYHEGVFKYITHLKSMELVEGEKVLNNTIKKGKFVYDSALHSMRLAKKRRNPRSNNH